MNLNARKQLAQQVRLLRTDRGWSQEVLAELSGLNRSYIGAVERAEHNIGLDNIERIARALEIPITRLLDSQTGSAPRCTGHMREQPLPPTVGNVVVHRRVFLELLRQCGQTHRELVLVYLERCGVNVCD